MSEPSRVDRAGLILTANACMFVFGVVLLLMGSLLPSLEVSYTEAGNLGSFPLIGIFAATVVVGPILDTVGAKPVLGCALVLIALALGVMPSLSTYLALAGAALAYGVGGGVLNTATNALVSDLNASGRGAALNLLGFFFSLGAVSAPLLMSSIAGSLPSAAVFHVLGGATAVILIPVLGLRFPPPARPGTRIGDLLRVLNQPLVWLFGVLLFFESGSENCMFVWSSKIVAEVLHASPRLANLALVGLSGALGVGRLFGALLLRWLGGRKIILLSTAMTAVGALTVYANTKFAWVLAGMVVMGLGMSTIFPTALGLAGDRFHRETGTVFASIMTVALVGGMAGPTLGAWVASKEPRRVLGIPVSAAAGIAILSLLLKERKFEESGG